MYVSLSSRCLLCRPSHLCVPSPHPSGALIHIHLALLLLFSSRGSLGTALFTYCLSGCLWLSKDKIYLSYLWLSPIDKINLSISLICLRSQSEVIGELNKLTTRAKQNVPKCMTWMHSGCTEWGEQGQSRECMDRGQQAECQPIGRVHARSNNARDLREQPQG